jgi:hypothetical protein
MIHAHIFQTGTACQAAPALLFLRLHPDASLHHVTQDATFHVPANLNFITPFTYYLNMVPQMRTKTINLY